MNNLIEMRKQITKFFTSDKAKWIHHSFFVILVFTFVFAGSSTVRASAPSAFGDLITEWYYWLSTIGVYLIILFCFLTKKYSMYELNVYFLLFIFALFHGQFTVFRWQMIYFLAAALLVKDEKLEKVASLLFWIPALFTRP